MTANEVAASSERVRHLVRDSVRRLRLMLSSDIPTSLWSGVQVVAGQISTHAVEELAHKSAIFADVQPSSDPFPDLASVPTVEDVEALLSKAVSLVDELAGQVHRTELAALVPAARQTVHQAYQRVASLRAEATDVSAS